MDLPFEEQFEVVSLCTKFHAEAREQAQECRDVYKK